MKKLTIIFIALMFSAGAFAFPSDFYQEKITTKTDSVAIAPGDTTEYELIVMDIGFRNWFITNRKPIWFHEKEYYHSKNTFYTINWNILVLNNLHRPPYEFEIIYDPKIDYGVEVEWQLFWYFKYMEQKYNIRIGP